MEITQDKHPQRYEFPTWGKKEDPTDLLCLFITAGRMSLLEERSLGVGNSRFDKHFPKNKGKSTRILVTFPEGNYKASVLSPIFVSHFE